MPIDWLLTFALIIFVLFATQRLFSPLPSLWLVFVRQCRLQSAKYDHAVQ